MTAIDQCSSAKASPLRKSKSLQNQLPHFVLEGIPMPTILSILFMIFVVLDRLIMYLARCVFYLLLF